MNKKQLQLNTKFCVIVAMFLFMFFATAECSNAEDVKSSVDGVTVLPAKFELNANRGDIANQTFQISNSADYDEIFAISLDNISTTGENGQVFLGDPHPNLPNLLSAWISFDQNSGILLAHQKKTINFKISVPKDAEPGGKYASIVISLDKVARNPGESKASAKVVSLVMLTVSGDIREYADAISFEPKINLGENKIDFVLRLGNHGNSHFTPKGTIVINNIFGKKVAEIPLESGNVLPGSIRQMTSTWRVDGFLAGRYSAALVADFGTTRHAPLATSVGFWVRPTLFMFFLLLIIITLTFSVLIVLRLRRQYR